MDGVSPLLLPPSSIVVTAVTFLLEEDAEEEGDNKFFTNVDTPLRRRAGDDASWCGGSVPVTFYQVD